MANIDVVPKKRTNVWLWLVIAIVLVTILFALGVFSGDSPNRVGSLVQPSWSAETVVVHAA